MTAIRRLVPALVVVGALSLPVVASAEQAPSELCEGDKMEKKEPTADKRDVKQDSDRSGKKSEDKSEPKPEPREADKS